MKYAISILCALNLFGDYSYAVGTNGVNQDEEYVELAKKPQFSAVGYISVYHQEIDTEGLSTGTIINDEGTGITCAHSFDRIILKYMEEHPNCLDFLSNRPKLESLTELKDMQAAMQHYDIARKSWLISLTIPLSNYYMGFDGEPTPFPKHKIVSVLVNPFYMKKLKLGEPMGSRIDVDNAIFKLLTPPEGITPIPVLSHCVGDITNGVFLGYGQGDTHHNQKRAAYLPNLKHEGKSNFFSSLFFDPAPPEKSDFSTDAMSPRNWHWHHNQGKPIYGHGQPGDSGGPLMIKSKGGQFAIIGTVSKGCGELSTDATVKELDLNGDKSLLYGKLQSGFSPLVKIYQNMGALGLELIEEMISAISLPHRDSSNASSSTAVTNLIAHQDYNSSTSTTSQTTANAQFTTSSSDSQ